MDSYNQLPHLELSGELMLWPAVFSFSPWWWWINSRWTNDDDFWWYGVLSAAAASMFLMFYICLLIFHSSTYPRLCRGCLAESFCCPLYIVYMVYNPPFSGRSWSRTQRSSSVVTVGFYIYSRAPRHLDYKAPSHAPRITNGWQFHRKKNRNVKNWSGFGPGFEPGSVRNLLIRSRVF